VTFSQVDMYAANVVLSQPGTPADRLKNDIVGVLRAKDAARDRNRQVRIGPSGLCCPCDRQLAYYARETPKIGQPGDPLAAWVGTAFHALADEAFTGADGWETGRRMEIGPELWGTDDLFHLPTGTVVDLKMLGKTSLDKIRRNGPGPQYRGQVHLYGFGRLRLGYEVNHVALACFPRSGFLRDVVLWTEPYDNDIVEAAFERWYTIKEASPLFTPDIFRMLPRADGPCAFCPYYSPSVAGEHPELACPGVEVVA
jgi:hypothetical protein